MADVRVSFGSDQAGEYNKDKREHLAHLMTHQCNYNYK